MEEPVCEPPAVALHYVTKLAREHVKVLLSGEGGDEAFAGYQNYRNLMWFERLKSLGPVVRGAASLGLALAARVDSSGRIQKYQSLLDATAADLLLLPHRRTLQSIEPGKARFVFGCLWTRNLRATSVRATWNDLFAHCANATPLQQMQYVDTKSWLPDDLC